jgi:hypothetical protein
MCISLLKKEHTQFVTYEYRPKVKLRVEASHDVDIFVCSIAKRSKIKNYASGKQAAFVYFTAKSINEILSLPSDFKDGWCVVVGNSNKKSVAVFYESTYNS